LVLKKTPVDLNYRQGNGAFLPIAPSYFKVSLRHDRKGNVRMKIILITTAAGNGGKNGIRRGATALMRLPIDTSLYLSIG
jgi:hypothetical protein